MTGMRLPVFSARSLSVSPGMGNHNCIMHSKWSLAKMDSGDGPVIGIYLWFFWKYLKGTDERRQLLRANPVPETRRLGRETDLPSESKGAPKKLIVANRLSACAPVVI